MTITYGYNIYETQNKYKSKSRNNRLYWFELFNFFKEDGGGDVKVSIESTLIGLIISIIFLSLLKKGKLTRDRTFNGRRCCYLFFQFEGGHFSHSKQT